MTDAGIKPWDLKHTRVHTRFYSAGVKDMLFRHVYTVRGRGMDAVETGLFPTVRVYVRFAPVIVS